MPGADPISTPTGARSYARFAKRDLDQMSWLAPLLNNPFGDLLNIELRHEQVFFVQGDQVIEDIGYSETQRGRRFSEAEFGKIIRVLGDLKKYGYWFVGREYDPEAMREALRRQQDGYYYSLFSNQCQNWADRLARGAERIERERGIHSPGRRVRADDVGWEPGALPTEPASLTMGLVALALGIGGLFAPVIEGGAFSAVLGAFFLASGVSHIIYGFHGKDWSNLLSELLISLINLVAGVFILWNHDSARVAGGAIFAITLGVQGTVHIALGWFSRPRSHWAGKLIAGFVMLAGTALIVAHWPLSGERALGVAVGASLAAGGLSTIVLRWLAKRSEARQGRGGGL